MEGGGRGRREVEGGGRGRRRKERKLCGSEEEGSGGG